LGSVLRLCTDQRFGVRALFLSSAELLVERRSFEVASGGEAGAAGFGPGLRRCTARLRGEDDARRIWKISEELIGFDFPIVRAQEPANAWLRWRVGQ